MAVLSSCTQPFAGSECRIFLLCAFFVSSLPQDAASIEVLTPQDVEALPWDQCVVVISQEFLKKFGTAWHEVDKRAEGLMDMINSIFRDEANIKFGVSDFETYSWSNGSRRSSFEIGRHPFFDLFLSAVILIGPSDGVQFNIGCNEFTCVTDNIFSVVREQCRLRRAVSRSSVTEGLRHRDVLDSMFRVEAIPHSPTVSEIFRRSDAARADDGICSGRDGGEALTACQSANNEGELYQDIPRCERIALPSQPKFVKEYLLRNKPVIITNAMDNWPPMSKWTDEFFRTKFDTTVIPVFLSPTGDYHGPAPVDPWQGLPSLTNGYCGPYSDLVLARPAGIGMTLSRYFQLQREISELSLNFTAYIQTLRLQEHFSSLMVDVEEMSFMKNTLRLDNVYLWLGTGNTLSKLHFDSYENFIWQISGSKEVILFDPQNNQQLYEHFMCNGERSFNPATNTIFPLMRGRLASTFTPIDIQNPDLKRFAKFGKARPMSCTIKEGEVLFIPSYWWHEVRSRPSPVQHRHLALNFWYDGFFQKAFPCARCRLRINPDYEHLLHAFK